MNAIWTSEGREDRKKKLMELIKLEASDVCENKAELLNTISRYHEAFSLIEDERGETDLVQLEINTGQAEPKRTPAQNAFYGQRGSRSSGQEAPGHKSHHSIREPMV